MEIICRTHFYHRNTKSSSSVS